ncbi:MAG TPA: heavy metal-associated domain-containing protein [Mobilitalea sp.]|nr:heavy metal-associated domain-containing protein [Mobilitalea sp.]
MNKIHYEVNGLINNQKRTQVKNVLDELDGVGKVNVDLDRGTVEVEYNDAANEKDIRQGIEHVGCKVDNLISKE